MALAIPIGIVITLPASFVLPKATDGLHFQRIEGTVWSGQAQLKLPKQSPLPIEWHWSGGLTWTWAIESEPLVMAGLWRLSDRDRLEQIKGHVDIQYLDIAQWLVFVYPVGQLEIDVDQLAWEVNTSLEIEGRLDWRSAQLRGLINESLGDISVEMMPSVSTPGETEFVIESTAQGAVGLSGWASTNGDSYRTTLILTPNNERAELLRLLSPLGRRENRGIRIERSGRLGVFDE